MNKELSETLKLRKSQLARAVLRLKGKPLDLDDYKPFELIYDTSPQVSLIKAGRQIGKSVSLGGMTIAESILRPYFNTIYIAPLSSQTSRFSTGYLDPFLYSPIIRKHFLDGSSKKNVFEKSLNNGSRIYLSYADDEASADRVRGASGDQLFLDEIQDISQEAIPILRETLSASDYGFVRLTGTAKTENNTLEINWKRSNMLEWVVKCTHCNRYTIPNDFETCLKVMEGKDGPACIHCGKTIDMKTGEWVAAKPHVKDFYGFHAAQLIVPARCRPKKWKELREKAFGAEGGSSRGYSTQKLANEVFGLASGVGGRILSLREAMACCNEERKSFDKGFPMDSRGIICTVLGVDWSVSGSTNSFTVISILGYDFNGKCYLLYSERLNGVDILEQVSRVEYLYGLFKCSMLGSDRGVGVLQGQLMKKDIGDDKVHMVQYCASKTQLRWDKEGGYFAADRTMCMDTMVLKAKMGPNRFETPAWECTSELWSDALNVFEEETANGRRVYRKDEDLTDDWLHSIVFANIAYMILRGDFAYTEKDAVPQADGFDF